MIYIPFILVIIYVVVTTLLYFNQERLLLHPDPLPDDYTYTFTAPFKEMSITTKKGESLNALHFTVPESKGLIVYYHGNAGSLNGWGEIAEIYLNAGFDLLIYDYLGFGKSTGKLNSEEELLENALLVYQEALKLRDEKEILIIGYSLGSGPASYVASKNQPSRLILKTPYYSLLKLAKSHSPWLPVSLIFKYPVKSHRFLQEVACPIAIFHGTADQVIPVEHSRLLTKEIKAEYFEIPNAPHGGMNYNPIFQNYINVLN